MASVICGLIIIMVVVGLLLHFAEESKKPDVTTTDEVVYYSFRDKESFIKDGAEILKPVVLGSNVSASTEISEESLNSILNSPNIWLPYPDCEFTESVKNLLQYNEFVVYQAAPEKDKKKLVYLVSKNKDKLVYTIF